MRPSFAFPAESSDSPAPSQTWQKSGSCPEGTVPIRRVGRQELLSAASLEHFGRDGPPTSSAVNTTTSDRFVYHNGSKYAIFPVADHSVMLFNYYIYIFLSISKLIQKILSQSYTYLAYIQFGTEKKKLLFQRYCGLYTFYIIIEYFAISFGIFFFCLINCMQLDIILMINIFVMDPYNFWQFVW
jgi:hypothetical protein